MSLCPRGVRRLVYRSQTVTRGNAKTRVKQWWDLYVTALPTDQPLVPHTADGGTVHTDLEFLKVTWRQRAGEEPYEHANKARHLTPVKSLLPSGSYRYDMRVELPLAAGWGRTVVATRVFAWHYLNAELQLSWADFTKPRPGLSTSYFWQVDHTNNDPTETLADKLALTLWWKNEGLTQEETARLESGVRRPRKRGRKRKRGRPKGRQLKKPSSALQATPSATLHASRPVRRLTRKTPAAQATSAGAHRTTAPAGLVPQPARRVAQKTSAAPTATLRAPHPTTPAELARVFALPAHLRPDARDDPMRAERSRFAWKADADRAERAAALEAAPPAQDEAPEDPPDSPQQAST